MQNKQKKYFGTDGIRGRVGEPPISADWILNLGWALGDVLSSSSSAQEETDRPKVLIGKDTRISGYLFESALEAGLSSAGVDTLLLGPMPTPAIAYLTRALRASAGIVISASHNPYYDNGIKFFSCEGTKLPDEMEWAIEEALQKRMVMVDSRRLGKAQRVRDAEGRYIEFCKNTFPAALDLHGLKLVVDCAHGATYRVAPSIFRELGALVIEMGVEPDGYNINEACGSTAPQALAERVLREKADVGIALDGDGDRVIMVDHQGEVLDGDEILYIIAKWYADTKRLNGGVVGTLMSNFGLELAFKSAGIEFCRVNVGDRYILEHLKKNAWNLGGESSGHIICLDANTTGDGIVSALRVLAVMCLTSRSLSELKQGMAKLPQILINVPVTIVSQSDEEIQDNQENQGNQKIQKIKINYSNLNLMSHPKVKLALQAAETQLKGQGRVLLRASGTEPVVRVMVEGQDAAIIQAVANELAEVVQTSYF
jgi:phosphoglucosamine mutase